MKPLPRALVHKFFLFIFCCCALLQAHCPAARAEIKWYIGGNVICSALQIKNFDYKKHGITTDYDDKRKPSFGLGMVTGYHFMLHRYFNVRLEFEHSLRSGGKFDFDSDKELDIYAYLTSTANLWYHPNVGDFPLKPYIGAGLGTGSVLYDQRLQKSSRSILPSPMLNGALGGGVTYQMSEYFFMDLGYRYHRGLPIKNRFNSDYTYHMTIASHNLMWGLRFKI